MKKFRWWNPGTWNQGQSVEQQSPTRMTRRSPANYDKTDSIVANRTLTKGLYYNEYPGMKLAGALAYNPIAIPVMFMGAPVVECDDDEWRDILQSFIDAARPEGVHTESHRDGTIWLWPYWDETLRQVRVEYIPDDHIQYIIRHIDTGDIIQIVSEVEMQINNALTKSVDTVRRTRTWTKEKITESWEGSIPENLRSKTRRNVTQSFPIPFANNKGLGDIRGRSDYSRIVVDLKNYHDIDLAQSEALAKFKTKWKQTGRDPSVWLTNNGFAGFQDFDPMNTDFIFNTVDEDTEILYLNSAALSGYDEALKRIWRKIVEGSGVPEICWGLKTEGNHASVEEQMGILVQFVKAKRKQAIEPWSEVIRQSMVLYSIGNMVGVPTLEYGVEWGTLDGLSEKTKSEIFGQFADGVAKLIGTGGITKRQLFNLWSEMYPASTDMNLEEFIRRISYMAKHNQYRNADYLMTLEMTDDDPEGGDPEGDIDE